eukprot:4004778-Heterocapsa_arctica.AAC.1
MSGGRGHDALPRAIMPPPAREARPAGSRGRALQRDLALLPDNFGGYPSPTTLSGRARSSLSTLAATQGSMEATEIKG